VLRRSPTMPAHEPAATQPFSPENYATYAQWRSRGEATLAEHFQSSSASLDRHAWWHQGCTEL